MPCNSHNVAEAHVAILLSGGIDSAATLAAYIRQRADITAVFIDYGQPARRSEWEAAQAVASHYGTPLIKIKLGFRLPAHNGEVFGRNALMALVAGAAINVRPLVIAAGIHAGTTYYDTTELFTEDMQRLLDGYAGGSVSLGMPFLTMGKPDIVTFARRHRVPLQLTYSCERKNKPSCGKCPSCMDRGSLHVK
jgi:7-cyano-7-deazaguanine synthase